MLNVELYRFKVKKEKSSRVDDWLKFLNDNMEDTLLTLEDEKMYVESIHREIINGEELLYWYSIQGSGGKDVSDSTSYIDIEHLKYWDECIDSDYKNNEIPTKVIMIPKRIREEMK
ncbi:MAG: DUF6176 family protein [Peptoniphilaceae bacterium]